MSRPTAGIATDASHSIKNGCTRFRGVDLKTGTEIFSENIGNQTVNVGEFLGVVAAVKYIIEHDYSPEIVYTDSVTPYGTFRAEQGSYALVDLFTRYQVTKNFSLQGYDTCRTLGQRRLGRNPGRLRHENTLKVLDGASSHP